MIGFENQHKMSIYYMSIYSNIMQFLIYKYIHEKLLQYVQIYRWREKLFLKYLVVFISGK